MKTMELNYLNLGTYEMGRLELPATDEEIKEFFATLNPTDQDVELQFVVTDLPDAHLDSLTLEQLRELSEMDKDEAETFIKILDAVGNYQDAKDAFDGGEYILFTDCDNMADVAYSWVHDHVGSLECAVSREQRNYYVDEDAIKRDLECDSYFANLEEETGEEMDEDAREAYVSELVEEGIFADNENYFDYEAFGRDMDIEGHFFYVGNSEYIQILL